MTCAHPRRRRRPEQEVQLATPISSRRLRCTAFQYDHRKANTPMANSASAVIAATHCQNVVKNTAASVGRDAERAVPARSAGRASPPVDATRRRRRGRARSVVTDTPSAAPEALGQHVVGELGHGALPRRLAHLGPLRRVVEQRLERRGDRAAGPRGGRTTSPVTPSSTASAAPPESPATCGTPHAAASTNTMPKPSCSSPPQRVRHGIANTSAQPYRRGRSSLATRPRNRTGASSSAARRAQPPLVAAAAGDRQHEVGSARRQQGGRLDRHVEALARHEPGDRHDQLGVVGQPERRGAAARRSSSSSGPEPLDVDARRHDRDRQRPARRPARPRGRRTRRPTTTWRARRSTLPSACLVPGSRPGTVTSAPCSTTSYGQLRATGRPARAAPPGRARRGRRRPRGRGRRSAAPSTGAAAAPARGVRSMRNGWAPSNCGGAVVRAGEHGEAVAAAAAATTPTAATGSRRSSAGSRS